MTKSPYGKPADPGNADKAWRSLVNTPCPKCGATKKHFSVSENGKRAEVRCGETN